MGWLVAIAAAAGGVVFLRRKTLKDDTEKAKTAGREAVAKMTGRSEPSQDDDEPSHDDGEPSPDDGEPSEDDDVTVPEGLDDESATVEDSAAAGNSGDDEGESQESP